MPEPQPKKVPPKNELKATPLSKERPAILGQDKNFHYEYLSTDPKHPSYIGKKLTQHALGDDAVGWTVADAWEPVQATTDPAVALLGKRDDQGGPVDTLVRHGAQILCRTTHENAAKYTTVHDARVELNSKGLSGREKHGGGVATARSVREGEEVSVSDVIRGAS